MSSLDSMATTDARVGRVITQIITRPSTTITAVVTLGGGPTSTTSTTTSSLSSATIAPAPSTTLNREQLGALLGSVFGFAFLVLLICCGLTMRTRRRRSQTTTIYVDDDDISTESDETRGMRETLYRTRAWNRGGGRSVASANWTMVPPPVRFPPTRRHTGVPYRQTGYPQMPGVARYP